MKKDKRKNLLILIAILILVIVVVIDIIIYRDINTEKYSISRKDGEKIINNLPYSNNIIYVIDDFRYGPGILWGGGINDSVCDIKIYDDGRVVGNGHYCNTEKSGIKEKVKFKLEGIISKEDTLALCNLINNKEKRILNIKNSLLEESTKELKKISLSYSQEEPKFKKVSITGGPFPLDDIIWRDGKEILTEFNIYNGRLVRNGVKISSYYNEIRETLEKYKIIEVK